MTEEHLRILESIYPDCQSEARIQHSLRMVDHFHDQVEKLTKMLSELSDDCLYTLHDIESVGIWVRKYTIEKTTPKRVYACLHEDHTVRNLTWERLVLNRQKLDAQGTVWHRATYQTLYTPEKISPILTRQRDQALSSMSAYFNQLYEMWLHYEQSGVALTDEEYRIATNVFGIVFDEQEEPEPVYATTHNWQEEGF